MITHQRLSYFRAILQWIAFHHFFSKKLFNHGCGWVNAVELRWVFCENWFYVFSSLPKCNSIVIVVSITQIATYGYVNVRKYDFYRYYWNSNTLSSVLQATHICKMHNFCSMSAFIYSYAYLHHRKHVNYMFFYAIPPSSQDKWSLTYCFEKPKVMPLLLRNLNLCPNR